MEVYYCSACGKRIPQEDFDHGAAARSGGDCYCAECAKTGSAPVEPRAAQGGLKARRKAPAARRALTPRERPRMAGPLAGVLVGIIAGLGAGIYLLTSRRRPPKHTVPRDARRERRVPPPAPAEGPNDPPPPAKEHKYVAVPMPPPARPGPPPDPPAPFLLREGERLLYGWDFRSWRPGLRGRRTQLRPGVNLLQAEENCGTKWVKNFFTVPPRGIIRARFFVTARTDVNMVVGVTPGRNGPNYPHTWKRVEPGRWFDATVATDSMRPWGGSEAISLPQGGTAHQIVLYLFKGQPGKPRLFISEIQIVAVE